MCISDAFTASPQNTWPLEINVLWWATSLFSGGLESHHPTEGLDGDNTNHYGSVRVFSTLEGNTVSRFHSPILDVGSKDQSREINRGPARRPPIHRLTNLIPPNASDASSHLTSRWLRQSCSPSYRLHRSCFHYTNLLRTFRSSISRRGNLDQLRFFGQHIWGVH